jgi:hypothetical protein
MAQYRGFHRDKFAQVSPKCPDPQIAHQRPFMREGCAPATWGRVEKTFQPHWSAQITLRARAALTTFKTLKTDRGTGFVTGSLIGPLARWGESGWKPNGQRHHGRVPTKQGGRADNSCGHLARCVQPNRPSVTIIGAVTGFEGFEGAGRSIAVTSAPWVDRVGSGRTPSSFRRCRA